MSATGEQLKAVLSKVHRLVIRAFAGAGKSYTLRLIAEAHPDEQILLLCYNKAIQLEAAASFPSNVTCKTTHSVAWFPYGERYKQAKKIGNLKPYHLTKAYAKNGMTDVFAKAIIETIENFMHSGEFEFMAGHVPASQSSRFHAVLLEWCRDCVWPAMCDVENRAIPMPEDGYLKLYQLSQPDLSARYDANGARISGYDRILYDEAQDANGATLDIVLSQSIPVAFVGDPYQSIYLFRKAINALDLVQADEVLNLTESRRFGQGIASLATLLLSTYRDEPLPVRTAFPDMDTLYTVDRSRQYTLLGRTNGSLFRQAVSMLGRQRMYFVGGLDRYPFDRLVELWHLMSGRADLVTDQLFRNYPSFARLEKYAQDTDDIEILALIAVVKEFTSRIPDLVARIKDEAVPDYAADEADVKLSTIHRAKGLEFEQVVLLSDFKQMVTDDGELVELRTPELRQELNLYYVAVTRAIRAIELNEQILRVLDTLAIAGDVAAIDILLDVEKGGSLGSPSSLSSEHNRAAESVEITEQAGAAPIAAGQIFAPGVVDTRDVSRNRFLGDHVGHRADVEEGAGIEAAIRDAILVGGELTAAGIAEYIERDHAEVVATIVSMIEAEQLSPKLFAKSPEIAEKLDGAGGESARLFL
ncbi:hypothetical protein A9R05_41775 (plasmid) [Burkholderia sp. KK1]|uniref:DNA 3'-5' helicase n=1 Tax=Burkholderia sp. M701 TaxID=326454 RepID=V5YML7_9BURK|nr:3'-5' exonuclease [Burkholderia sp. M701]AQH05557.1 hypothetical protein A9R05_41775 [Burkholderia sp. KK1]BAO18825.1 superfamily I DNA and RNA helicases-like protein [Burkholderia sp. M701]